MIVDNFLIDEALLYLIGYVITQNYESWATEIPLETQTLTLLSAKTTVCCRFMASFIIGLIFCRRWRLSVLLPSLVKCYKCLLHNHVITGL